MAPWLLPAIGAGVGALGGLLGRDSRETIQQVSGGNSQGESSFTPWSGASPLYSMVAGIGNQMGGTPIPFFPGMGYVGPSGPTQAGVNAGMGAIPWYQQAAGIMGGAAPALQGAANAAGAAAPIYQGASDASIAAAPGYWGAADASSNAAPMYQGAAGASGAAAPMYQGAANASGAAAPMYQGAAGAANAAAPFMVGAAATGVGNYNFLSRSADVANNPYVRNMMQVNRGRIGEALREDWLPALQQGFSETGAGALGSSRHGLAQSEAVQNAAKELGRANTELQLGAYGQGLNAQQNALGMLGGLQQGMLAPSTAMGQAGRYQDTAAASIGQAGRYQDSAAASIGQAGRYQDSAALSLGNAGRYGDSAAASINNAGRYQDNAAASFGNAGDYMTSAGNALGGAGDLMNTAGRTGLDYGQVVENYQQRALEDAMARFNHQYEEPWMRTGNIGQLLGYLSSLGVQNTSGQNLSTGAGANPGYQSPFQSAFNGGMAGAGMGGNFFDWMQRRQTPQGSSMGVNYGVHADRLGNTNYGS